MRGKPETDAISINFNPDMTASVTCTPSEENHGIVLVKTASSFESILVECFEHLREAAFLQNSLCILADSQAPGLVNFPAEDALQLFFFLVRSIHHFQTSPM